MRHSHIAEAVNGYLAGKITTEQLQVRVLNLTWGVLATGQTNREAEKTMQVRELLTTASDGGWPERRTRDELRRVIIAEV